MPGPVGSAGCRMRPCSMIVVHNVLYERVMYRANAEVADVGACATSAGAADTDARHSGNAHTAMNRDQVLSADRELAG
jgi:hypothetical protein